MFKNIEQNIPEAQNIQEIIDGVTELLDEIAPGIQGIKREAIIEVAKQHTDILSTQDGTAQIFTQEAAKFIAQEADIEEKKENLVVSLNKIAKTLDLAA